MTLLFLLVFALEANAGTPSMKQREDPFRYGFSSQLTLSATGNSDVSTRSAVFQSEYAWDSGMGVQLIVPTILGETNPKNPGNSTPRIGGGPNGRIEADGLFRAFGDTYDYLGFLVGAGFPWQSSGVAKKSPTASWLLELEMLGRIDFEWIAIVARLTDSPSFPAETLVGNTKIFYDSTNSVSLGGTVYFYPYSWMAPYIGYTETFPSAINTSFDQGLGYFSLTQTPIGRTRVLAFGADFAPANFPILLEPEFEYIPVTPVSPTAEIGAVARIRWLF
jgi:hypothetical protein